MDRLIAALFMALFFLPVDAEARRSRVDSIPNGTELGCGVCHLRASGGGTRTAFGDQIYDALPDGSKFSDTFVWDQVYNLDGDGDGYTNGEELGDPEGTWRIGDPNPPDFTDPSSFTDGLCGDLVLNGNEECDGDPGEAACADEGLGPGTVTCNDRCRLDFSGCEMPDANNTTANNSTSPNNSTSGESTANTNTGNNATSANNATTGSDDTSPGIDDDFDDPDSACSTSGSTPGFLAFLLALLVMRRRTHNAPEE